MTNNAKTSPEIPDKNYFKIGEVCALTGVKPHTLRYWENEFPLIKPRRAGSRQRLYRRRDIETILKIKHLLHEEGLTIAGARRQLRRTDDTGPPAPQAQLLEKIKQELIAIKAILQ